MKALLFFLLWALSNAAWAGADADLGTLAAETARDGKVAGGDQDEYRFKADAGRILHIGVSAEDDNAAFQLFHDNSGAWTVVPGTEDAETIDWEDKLAVGGNFKVIVKATRDTAAYRLEMQLQ